MRLTSNQVELLSEAIDEIEMIDIEPESIHDFVAATYRMIGMFNGFVLNNENYDANNHVRKLDKLDNYESEE